MIDNITEEQLIPPIPLDVAQQTLIERLPQGIVENVRYIPGGGSFSVFAINNAKVARFPKFVTGFEESSIVEEQFRFEKLVLKSIYPQLAPHQISHPDTMLPGPGESFPGPVLIYKWLEGTPISQFTFNDTQLQQLAHLLGDFFSRLHNIDRTMLTTLGFVDVTPEQIKQGWFASFERHRQTTFQLLTDEERSWFVQFFEHFLADADSMLPQVAFCHGDCTTENVMLTNELRTLQVVDWDDMVIGDPASDLCEWMGYFGEDFLYAILNNYALQIDPLFVQRVKFYYCRIPLLYFSMAQLFESSRFLDFARQKFLKNREKSRQQGWFHWA